VVDSDAKRRKNSVFGTLAAWLAPNYYPAVAATNNLMTALYFSSEMSGLWPGPRSPKPVEKLAAAHLGGDSDRGQATGDDGRWAMGDGDDGALTYTPPTTHCYTSRVLENQESAAYQVVRPVRQHMRLEGRTRGCV
jgi:hypothetical protein